MCGIVGFLSNDQRYSEEVLKNMVNAILHRGPDMQGYYVDNINEKVLGLGHARLSILDLTSEYSKQPMSSIDGRYTIIFNGEIYNYIELKKLLNESGVTEFRTTTDTEVILGMYSVFREKCLDYFNGMFAFAIYDNFEKSLFIARDRLGKKPLYFYKDEETFSFASEIKALIEIPSYKREVDYSSLTDFLKFRYVRNPKTLFKNIYKVQPGYYIKIINNEFLIKQYWDIKDFNDYEEINEKQIEDLLLDSVKLRMRSDVEVGAFLSGGLDSSIIVGMMKKFTDKKINTFSVGFKEKEFSELSYAKIVAQELNTNHHELIISGKDIIENLEDCTYYRDEPVSETSEIAIYLLSKEAKKNVTVILSGEGSDECFAGYPKYLYDTFAENKLINCGFKVVNKCKGVLPFSKRKLRLAIEAMSITDYKDRYDFWFSSFSNKEINELLLLKEESNEKINYGDYLDINDNLKRMQYHDIKYWLTDNLLDRADKMLMAFGLEGRMPFLDYRLVEDSFKLTKNKKINGKIGKKIIKDIASEYIPKEIIERKKSGFYIPVAKWFREDMKEYVLETLLGEKARNRGIFNIKYIEQIVNDHMLGKVDNYKKIWMLISLEIWFRKYIDN